MLQNASTTGPQRDPDQPCPRLCSRSGIRKARWWCDMVWGIVAVAAVVEVAVDWQAQWTWRGAQDQGARDQTSENT